MKNRTRLTIHAAWLLLAVLVGVVDVHAERLYKWVDAEGNVSYHDKPAPQDSGYKVEEKDFGYQTGSSRESGRRNTRNVTYPVTLYLTPRCASCDLVRQYLDGKKLAYSVHDVSDNLAMQAELKRVSGELTVPTVKIGKHVVSGYNVELLDKLLTEAGYLQEAPETKP
ncbi:MAG: glutaredoxin family protein [Gammaproteobacteria bacterium]|nr:glutaredoxin family protein [Gammaproteobacteria bacterium]